jgi:hypothetical protein
MQFHHVLMIITDWSSPLHPTIFNEAKLRRPLNIGRSGVPATSA